MKLTATTTSTSLYDLIETQEPEALELIEAKVIKGWTFWNYWVEVCYLDAEVGFETVLEQAVSGECRTISSSLPTFAFNTTDLRNIQVVWGWDFIISIV